MAKSSLKPQKDPKFDVIDSFFFYPLHKKGNAFEKRQAKNLIEIYSSYRKNLSNIVKEIIDMDQLIANQTIDISNFLSENPINSNYSKVFENFVRRASNYEQQQKEKLFNTSEDLEDYITYLIESVKPKARYIEIVNKFIHSEFNSKRR